MQEAGRPVLVGTVSVEKSEILGEMLTRRGHQARGPERQVPREGGAGSSPRPAGPARSRSPRTWPAAAPTSCSAATRPASPRRSSTSGASTRPRSTRPTYDEAFAEAKARLRRGPRAGRRRRRAPHRRHRAPRQPPDRQPAPRPRRPPGRPRLVALLPVPRGRPDEALRLGPRRRASWSASASRTTSSSSRASSARRSRAPRPGSRASTSTSASASSSSTTSSTSSARRSTPSATRSSTTRT